MAWNPSQYLKFGSVRLRPAVDLLNRASSVVGDVNQVKTIMDLGCGTGHISEMLCRAFPQAKVEGLDSSAQMIGRALKDSAKSEFRDRLSFRVGTVEHEAQFKNKKYDLVYSNATLHWCTGHAELFPDIVRTMVNPNGGVLAVQVPDTREQTSHVLMDTAAFRSGMLDKIRHVRVPRIEHDATWYYNLLSPMVKEIDMWTTQYVQQLPALAPTQTTPPADAPPRETEAMTEGYDCSGDNGNGSGNGTNNGADSVHDASAVLARHPVLEYTKSTGLLPIIEALGGENSPNCQTYLSEYDRLLHDAYPIMKVANRYTAGSKYVTLFPFKRLFIVCKL